MVALAPPTDRLYNRPSITAKGAAVACLPLANIFARKTRTTISILAVGVGVALFLVLIGLTSMLREIADRTTNVNAHLMVWPASDQVVLSGGLPADKVQTDLETIPGIARAVAVLRWPLKMAGRIQNVYGIRPQDWDLFAGPDRMVEGRALEGGDEMVIDTRLARAGGYRLGDAVERWVHDRRHRARRRRRPSLHAHRDRQPGDGPRPAAGLVLLRAGRAAGGRSTRARGRRSARPAGHHVR